MSDYNAWYTKGWTAAQRTADLEGAESRFLNRTGEPWNGAAHHAFEDGWLDWAAGREKYHLRDCPDHENCGRVICPACPRCGSTDTYALAVPRPGSVGDPFGMRCHSCGGASWIDNATGQWRCPARTDGKFIESGLKPVSEDDAKPDA